MIVQHLRLLYLDIDGVLNTLQQETLEQNADENDWKNRKHHVLNAKQRTACPQIDTAAAQRLLMIMKHVDQEKSSNARSNNESAGEMSAMVQCSNVNGSDVAVSDGGSQQKTADKVHIVLTSTWRTSPEVWNALVEAGLPSGTLWSNELHATPDLQGRGTRGDEIVCHLQRLYASTSCKLLTSFAILDDQDIGVGLPLSVRRILAERFVHVNGTHGLQSLDASKSLQLIMKHPMSAQQLETVLRYNFLEHSITSMAVERYIRYVLHEELNMSKLDDFETVSEEESIDFINDGIYKTFRENGTAAYTRASFMKDL